MTKVFAALIFLCLISGCTKPSLQKSLPQHSNSEMEIIYSAPGDFNGDGKTENISLLNSSTGKHYLNLNFSDKTYKTLLTLDISNFSAWIEDVDGNKKDDLILCTFTCDTPLIYVFTYDKDIKLLISPGIIESKIKLENIKPFINTSDFISKKNLIMSKVKYATLISTDVDIIPGESLFTCDYNLSDEHNSLGYISVSFTINNDGKITIIDVHEFEKQSMDL